MKTLILGLTLLFLAACNRPEKNPELADAIFNDIQAEIGNSHKAVEEAKKQREDFQAQMEKAEPQTGRSGYFRKRVDSADAAIARLQQQEKFWTIRSDSRRDYVRLEYLKAFKKGKEWNSNAEWAEYQSEKRLRQARVQWDAKGRRDNFLKESGLDPKARKPAGEGGEGGEAKPATKKEE